MDKASYANNSRMKIGLGRYRMRRLRTTCSRAPYPLNSPRFHSETELAVILLPPEVQNDGVISPLQTCPYSLLA